MRSLRLGSMGDDVSAWQASLRALGHAVVPDGIFGPITLGATKLFQRAQDLDQDGIVGPKTRAAMKALQTTWPAAPAYGPLTDEERRRIYGTFAYVPSPTASNPEAIRITDSWPAHNIVVVSVPQLVDVEGAAAQGRVMCHKLVAEKLRELFRRWEQAGLRDRVLNWAGMWAPRFVRGSRTTLSNHAWGTAFDINAAWNPLGRKGLPAGIRGSVAELVPIANELGWFSGSHFTSRPDPMHFELTVP